MTAKTGRWGKEKGQEDQNMRAKTGQLRQDNRGWANLGRDRLDRTVGIGHLTVNNWDRAAGTGQIVQVGLTGQPRQHRGAGWPGQDSWNMTRDLGTKMLGQDRRARIAREDRRDNMPGHKTAGTGQPLMGQPWQESKTRHSEHDLYDTVRQLGQDSRDVSVLDKSADMSPGQDREDRKTSTLQRR